MQANIHSLFYLQQQVHSLLLSLALLSQLVIRWSLRQNGFKSQHCLQLSLFLFHPLTYLFSCFSYVFVFHTIFCSFLFLCDLLSPPILLNTPPPCSFHGPCSTTHELFASALLRAFLFIFWRPLANISHMLTYYRKRVFISPLNNIWGF